MATGATLDRLDRLERELHSLESELAEIRRIVGAAGTAAAAGPEPAAAQPAVAPPLERAWAALERGDDVAALDLATKALAQARRAPDRAGQSAVAAFVEAARTVVEPRHRGWLDELAEDARPPAPPWPPAPWPTAPPARPPTAQRAAPPPKPLEVGMGAHAQRGRDHTPTELPSADRVAALLRAELSGGRGFAVAGGVVTLLGVVFLFVLAANRGWIGPVARVTIGGAASVAVTLTGVGLRARFGRLHASLAAVGAGIAGAYATLAAATIIYAFLPKPAALLLAALIGATGTVLSLAWSTELLAGLSLVGAAAAPGLVALDDGVGAAGTAFAVIVMAASAAAAVQRRWLWLVLAVHAIALAQVGWLTDVASARDAGAIAVVAAAAAVLLCTGTGRQATATAAGVDPLAATFALGGGGLAFGGLAVLLPSNRDLGIALALAAGVYGAAGLLARRRWRDFAWVAGAVALLLAGIATSYAFSQRSLTVAWAIEAAVLAALAWRLVTPRFELVSIGYLAIGVAHLLFVDVWNHNPAGDPPTASAPGSAALAAAAIVGGTLLLGARSDAPSAGILAALEPVWDGLVRARGSIRLALYVVALVCAAAATAALVSGRALTLVWLGASVLLAATARVLGERRLQAASLVLFLFALVHALAVEAQPATFVLERGQDALAPVPSIAALAGAAAVLAQAARFSVGGIVFLGPLAGGERVLERLGTHARALRIALLCVAVWSTVWATGLGLVRLSYEPGQALATALWALVGIGCAALAARRRDPIVLAAAAPPAVFAFAKAALVDWHRLGDGWAAAALLAAAAGVLLVGFFLRYAAADAVDALDLVSLAAAVAATVAALIAVDRLVPGEQRALGAAALGVSCTLGALASVPFRDYRRRLPHVWPRNFATVYWSLALVTLAYGEYALLAAGRGATVAVWALTAAGVATAATPLGEQRLWLAGAAGSVVAAIACLELVTVPSRLVASSAHPGRGLWALAACVAALAWIARRTPKSLSPGRNPLALSAVALAVFGLSLGVLEIAERVSGASVATDFQRGQTAVSVLWGLLALVLFVAGLIRSTATPRRVGLALFGLALAKLFLYDLRNLSSITRALSFLVVGAILLTAAFFAERTIGGGRHGPKTA